jgi:hypothetical protein
MDVNDLVRQVTTPSVTDIAIRVGLGLVVLVVGWLLSLFFAWLTRKLLGGLKVDQRMAKQTDSDKPQISVEDIGGKIVYYLGLLITVVAVFYVLNLLVVANSLNIILEGIMAVIPNLLGAAVLAVLAWVVATFLRFIVSKGLGLFKFDDKMADQVGLREDGRPPLGDTLGTIVYWFVWLLFLPAILDVLELEGLLEPVNQMVAVFLVYLPNIVGAALIILFGWAIAQIVRKITVSFLSAIGTDTLGERVGIKPDVTGGMSLSQIIGLIVYILILIPVIVAGLQALQIEAISAPATLMLASFFDAIPAIIGAVLIIGVSYFVARLLANLVTTLLTSIGFNKVLSYIGLGGEPEDTKYTPSQLVGYLTLVAIMLFATVEAARMLGFEAVGVLVAQFTAFFFQVILALIVMGLGLFAANLAYRVVVSTAGKNAHMLGQLARVVIIIFAGAIALYTLGIAEDIVNLAFGLVLLAVAVAFGLAFGLGGRDVAGRELENWVNKLHSGDSE